MNPEDEQKKPEGDPPPGPVNQEVHHSQVSARVPSTVGRGAFSTGVIVMQGSDEFVLDFLLMLAQPHQLVARVVLPPRTVERFIHALQENLRGYKQNFGAPTALPTQPPGVKQPPVEEVYDQLKIADESLSGQYANAVMIGHTPAEFWFDFITNFYPRSAVSSRVFLAAPQVPRFLDTLSQAFQKYRDRQQGGPPPAAGA